MSRPPKVLKLPQRERREMLAKFLEKLDRDPELGHFRTVVREGPERQLALFAALERAALRGGPAVCPPVIDDAADQLLCDILDAIERDPDLSRHGAYYGADRQRATLQALRAWSGREAAGELFATAFSQLSADAAASLPACGSNCSPDPQVSAPIGELIGAETAKMPGDIANGGGLIRHGAKTSGEECNSLTTLPASSSDEVMGRMEPVEPMFVSSGESQTATTGSGFEPPVRAVRRGRPVVLDDVAKGRLLGLMSLGLSFRQAAAQLGVHHQTLLNALKRDEEYAQQVAEARLDAISQPLLVIVQAARKNWRAAAWLTRFLDDRRTSSYESTPEERELLRKRA